MYRFFKRNREALKKYLLIFFLSVVSIGMVITLAPIPTGDTTHGESNALASVGGTNITTSDLQKAVQAQTRNYPQADMSKMMPVLAGNTLDAMMMQQVLALEAKKMGIEVSDRELAMALQSFPWLSQNGAFVGMDRYPDLVSQETGMPVPQFEAELRNRLLRDKLRAVVTDGVEVTPQEVMAEFERRNAKAKIAYVLFNPSDFTKDVRVTPEALEAFFKKDPEHYRVPEQRSVRYVLIDPDQVRAMVHVTEEEARQYYAQHLSEYRVPDRVKVAQILFKTEGKAPAEVATVKKTAQDALDQIRKGANFADLAKKYSEDTTTAPNGGEVGWVGRGQTVKEFEDTAFSLQPGQVSGLVKTGYGIHIIKVEDKQNAHLQSFDEVKAAVGSELEKQKLADAQDKLASTLESQLRHKPDAFAEIVHQAGLQPQTSGLFKYGQAVPDLGNGDSFETLAFQLHKGEVGPPITVPKGQAIIQTADIVPEHVPTLDEVRARVEADYRLEQSKVMAADKAKQFAAQAKTADFAKIAKADHLTVKESKEFTQQESVEGLGSGSQLSAAFTLKAGQTSGVIPLGENNVVFRVLSQTPANTADFAGQRDQISEELLDRKRDLAFELYRQNLKVQLEKSGEVKINITAFNQFLALYQNK